MGIKYDMNTSFVKARIKICKKCPLYYKRVFGSPICNPDLYLNPETNKVSTVELPGYYSGCGCPLYSKVTDIDDCCPLGKW